MLGVDRYELRVRDIAAALARHPATATGWVMGVRGRHENLQEAARLEGLDKALSRPQDKEDEIHVPDTFRAAEGAGRGSLRGLSRCAMVEP